MWVCVRTRAAHMHIQAHTLNQATFREKLQFSQQSGRGHGVYSVSSLDLVWVDKVICHLVDPLK